MEGNRLVKFRGWDKDTERWYYGSYVRLERTAPYPMSQFPDEDKRKFENEQVDHYIFFTQTIDWGLETRKLRASVDPKSVGQYTSLHDKNGVEIYEGDIVYLSDRPDKIGIVTYYNGCLYVQGDDGWVQDFLGEKESDGSIVEVIGNIYEQPELMGATK